MDLSVASTVFWPRAKAVHAVSRRVAIREVRVRCRFISPPCCSVSATSSKDRWHRWRFKEKNEEVGFASVVGLQVAEAR